MTLTLDISKQTFHMTLELVEENKCAKLFWNQFINVEIMLWTRMNIWPSTVTLILGVLKQTFRNNTSTFLRTTSVQNHFEIHS